MTETPKPIWQNASQQDTERQVYDIELHVNGHSVKAHASDTVATALLRAGYSHFGLNTTTGRALAPSCLMGVCFGCLCTIDGRPGTQACLEPVREGLQVSVAVVTEQCVTKPIESRIE